MIKDEAEGWDDFPMGIGNAFSARDSYESFKIFKTRFKELPKAELIKRGWIKRGDDYLSLVDFYRDVQAERGGALFRKIDSANVSLFSLWLSKVRSSAQEQAFLNDIPRFDGIDRAELKELAQMSVDVSIVKSLPKILARKGIILVYSRALPGMKLDGAVFKIETNNPVIGLSFRYPRLDHFWFTLMHELAHINLHLDLLDRPILEDLDISSDSSIEISANRLAKNSFVDRQRWRNCEPKYNKSAGAVEKFANEIGVHKSIVAGMLQKETGDFVSYNDIVNEVNVRGLVFDD